jgi:pSer/pThr/pTyr-binding forkhead associated (FHA) protein
MPSLLLLHGVAEPNPCPCIDIAPAANAKPIARLFVLPHRETVLGRSTHLDGIRLDHMPVNKIHARIFAQDGRFFLEDMHSTNRTHLNFMPVHAPVELHDGELISLTDILFLFSKATGIPPGAHQVPEDEQRLAPDRNPREWGKMLFGKRSPSDSFLGFPSPFRSLIRACAMGGASSREAAGRFDFHADQLRTWLSTHGVNEVKKGLSGLEEFLRALFALVESFSHGQSTLNPLFDSVCACRDYWFRWLRELLRALGEVAGVTLYDPSWLEWNDGTIRKLVLGIRERQTFEDLTILADALEEAGCADAELLSHCCNPGGHRRVCWVIEMLLAEATQRSGREG